MAALYQHVAVLECAEPAGLNDLLAAGLGRFVVRRLGPTAAVVDHERLEEIQKLLKRLGQTPRVRAE